MLRRRRYRNPPIEEALCEFRFKPGKDVPWDPTISGRLHTKLSEEYTGTPREKPSVEMELDAQASNPQSFQFRYRDDQVRVQLLTKDEKRVVGIGHDVLTVHMLRPYQDSLDPETSGWDEFQPRISLALSSYWDVAQPEGVRRIGIRYINKIMIPQTDIDVLDYLNGAVPNVPGLPSKVNHFMSRIEYAYEDNVRLILSQGLIDAPSNHVGLLLDVDVIWEDGEPIAYSEALEKVGELRGREREAFETIVTNKSKELFDAD